jgi:uroporphyrinogen decarboxylase
MMHGGRARIVTRKSTYQVPEGRVKHPIPHFWYLKEGLTTKEAIRDYMEKTVRYSKGGFKRTKKLIDVCERKYNLIVATGLTGPWENLHFGIGFGNIAKFWRKDREFLHEINDFYINFSIKGMQDMVRICKPRVVMIGDDYGYNTGLQMSLEMWRELVKPALKEYVKIVHDAGGKCILHSCGKIEELFEDFVEIGLDGVESLKPKNNDLIGLKKKFGDKIALIGAIDDSEMLKYSSPEEVKKSVTQSIKDLGPGGFIPGATNFLLDQPVENIFAMLEAIRDFKV